MIFIDWIYAIMNVKVNRMCCYGGLCVCVVWTTPNIVRTVIPVFVMFQSLTLRLYTVWSEILVENLFWRIGGFESNPPRFQSAKHFTVCRYTWRHQYVIHNRSKCPHEIFKLRKNGTKIVQIRSTISWFQLLLMYYGSKQTQQCLHYYHPVCCICHHFAMNIIMV